MKIVVVGGTGLIGAKLVPILRALGHETVAAARATGVNSFTGEGLAEALDGANAIVDVSNSSYLDEAGALEFFEGSTLNLLTYGAAAGVAHHVALSVVGTERLATTEGGYFRAKFQQEKLIRESGRPYTIVHSTQFFEFLKNIADAATHDNLVRVSQAFVQPIAADDVADALAQIATGAPQNRVTEIAGPDQARLEDIVRSALLRRDDPRQVAADPLATYFGNQLEENELLPSADARHMPTHFAEWSSRA
jgi:uncharacterized protein YbjT (DUF2867 family)